MQAGTRSLQGVGVGFGIGLAALLAMPLDVSAAPSNVAAWTHVGLGLQTIGGTVGTAGDFNCDDIADLLLGGPDSDLTAGGGAFWTNVGWVGIHFGGSTLPPQPNDIPDWVVVGNSAVGTNQTGARAGARIAAGDVNRDGCDDVITTTESTLGAGELVQVYFGSAGGPSTSFGWRRFIGGFGAQTSGSVASGDVNGDGTADIIVGAPDANLGLPGEGAVLVWLGSQFLANVPDGVGNPDWFAESNQSGAALGTSVATGDVNGDGRDDIVAGAPNWDGSFPGSNDTGIALMWSGSPVLDAAVDGTPANASWSLQIGSPAARLGASVAVAGDLDGDGFADIVMGAPSYDNIFTAGTNEGTVLVSRGAFPAPPTDVYSWTHPGQVSGARLGYAVASAGDVNGDGRADYLMSEPDIQVDGFVRGRVHLLLGRPTVSWTINPATDVFYTEANTGNATFPARYAWAIGTAGDWNNDGFSDVVIGAPWKNSFAGQAFVYLGGGDTLKAASSFTLRNGQADSNLGLGVAFAGDINHDGFTDIVGGAPNYEDQSFGQIGEGRIFVGYGGPCEPDCSSPIAEIIFPGDREGNQAGAQLGWSVSSAGDVNGDGYADVIAGAPTFDGSRFCPPPTFFCPVPDSGVANVYLGGGAGLAFTPDFGINGSNQQGSQFGYSVANAGDVNGDGFGDVIVGAPYYDAAAGADEGRVFLYLGSASGLSTAPSWIESGGQANAHLGIDVAGAGDVNGDGFSDVIIGAEGFGATGAAFVYLGRPTNPTFPQGLSDTPIRTLVGLQAGSQFGITVATAGDLNRDGFSDVAVGAPEHDDEPEFGPQIGMVSVYHGAAGGPSGTPTTNLFGSFPSNGSNRFGNGVAGAGDVNGDGFGDLIVGDQWLEGPAGFAQGMAFVFHGGPNGITSTIANRSFQDCPTSFCDFGRDVAGAGDLNGDGFSDVLIAAFGFTQTASREGGIFVHLGNEGRGRSMALLQTLGFNGAPRAILGATADSFDAVMNLKSPAGRTRAAFELEVKSIGQNFDGLGTLRSVMLDNALTGRTSLTVLGLPGSVYTWRARLRSASTLFGRSRWISLPENAAREMDVRVLPEPGIAAAVWTGIGALAGLERRRRSWRSARRAAID